MIKLLQVGMGPLGVKVAQYIAEKDTMCTVGALDTNPRLESVSLPELIDRKVDDVKISSSINELNGTEIDAIVLTTSSDLRSISSQLDGLMKLGKPIISSCEELTYPWNSDLAKAINEKAIANNVAIVSTGVNPGFLMDTLPSMLTSVCKEVSKVEVNRIQDAVTRRIPFQKKIGAGLTLEEFDNRKKDGSLRHVGLTESMQFIARQVGWELDHTEDVISPIIAENDIKTDSMEIPSGYAMGVKQVGRATVNGEEKIRLVFEAAVGLGHSYDEVQISGKPNICSRIDGGVHGDIATCSILLNTIPVMMNVSPGLKTMADIPLVSFAQ